MQKINEETRYFDSISPDREENFGWQLHWTFQEIKGNIDRDRDWGREREVERWKWSTPLL